ncbi:MAG: hypothetical protein JWL84_5292 [Rhodospirillales bacterium]|nr:hypothetical protein [Rhodospirillales bacterium]
MARGRSVGAAASVLLALAVIPGALAQEKIGAQDKIGVTGAVNPAVTAVPPGLPERTLVIGTDVVYNERITTTADGQAQFLFLDKSALSVGPNSDIVIDEFVYNPNAGAGHLVANATKGVFRFVGGALSKQDGGVAIKVGATTIGVRGGMVGFSIDPGGAVQVLKYYGDIVKVTTPEGSREIYRNDYYVSVDRHGAFGQSRPLPVPRDVRLAVAQPLNPMRGTTGGGKQQPTETSIRQSGYTRTNSEDVFGARADASSYQTISDPSALNPTALASLLDPRTIQQISAVSFHPTPSAVVLPPPAPIMVPPPITPMPPPVTRLICVPRDDRDRHRHFSRLRDLPDVRRHSERR